MKCPVDEKAINYKNVSINLRPTLTCLRGEECREVGPHVWKISFLDLDEVDSGSFLDLDEADRRLWLQLSADFDCSVGVGVDDPS